MSEPILEYIFTEHASFEMSRRGIEKAIVHNVLTNPDQRFEIRKGRDVLQSKVYYRDKTYLVRVFVDIDGNPPEVVTVYRTGKIEKYWREDS